MQNPKIKQDEKKEKDAVIAALDQLATMRVPHNWFTSFYAVSVACSLLWASQLLLPNSIFNAITVEAHERDAPWMTWRQVALTWILMLVQGSRRLFECLAFYRPSSSQMWVGHWVLGIAFYVVTSIAVWVEGVCEFQANVKAE